MANNNSPMAGIPSHVEMGSLEEHSVIDLEDECLINHGSIDGRTKPPQRYNSVALCLEDSGWEHIWKIVLSRTKVVFFSNKINLLVPCGPLAILVDLFTGHQGSVFLLSLLGTIPLAERLGWITEPVLMLGETFLKGRHKGCLLAATAKNGNQGILTPERDIAFVTDRHGGLLKALAEVFPFSCHSFCLMHLKTNLKTYLSVKSRESKEYLLTLFSICAYAPTIELFNELFEEFKGRCGRSVERFLEDLSNECWCNAYFQGKRYGEMCTNTAESFNS
ncbi:uncharacterized protein LOC114269624 isoform X3 [Camellia sinensis]|uniref:uncharacterized protein LOC114269624 isoform X3 n=1 Tax=Camellia sinensis TaxID=4442 RepID=UPI001035C021|nr:uncharacterized protein LOC114269624 isoform X3 [Camellia sinensis]XP_028066788.1 uncharacterized protein LOC114269624 isoform X3 [Camellia sinensis]XP_028066789.1 uncharacterized protein LOC114269624 isoform X3 [Camellia sinensis]